MPTAETSVVALLVQSGLAGICIALIWLVYKMQNGQRSEQNDVIRLNTEAWIAQTKSQEEHSAAISRLTERIDLMGTRPSRRRN